MLEREGVAFELAEHPAVREVSVIGVPDDRWGERLVAVVVPHDGFDDAEALVAFAKESLGSVKAPSEIRWASALPQTPVGKVNKVALRAREGV